MGFFTPLSVNTHPGGRFKLTAPLKYRSRNGDLITVPEGTITDFASIPKALRVFFSVNGRHRKAATLHDYLYGRQSKTRLECDDLFLEGMQSLRVPYITRYLMYWGVRSGGWVAWNNASKILSENK